MVTFDYAMCHNLNTFKLNNQNGWLRSIFHLKLNFHQKLFQMPHVKFSFVQMLSCKMLKLDHDDFISLYII